MRKNILSVLTILAVLAFFCQTTWAGESLEEINLQGATAYKGHSTHLFGQDLRFVTLVGKQEPQPPILRLQSGSITESTTTTTFSRCKERKEGRLTQAYFLGEEKKVIKQAGFQDAVNPANGQPPWTVTVGGTGHSIGNLAIPALISGGSFVAGNAVAPGTNIAINAVAKGGKMMQGQNQGQNTKVDTKVDTNVDTKVDSKNTNINPIKIDNSATGTGIGTGTGTATINP